LSKVHLYGCEEKLTTFIIRVFYDSG